MFGHTMLHTLFLTSVICQINFRGSRRKLQRDNPVLRIAEGFTVGSSANIRLYPFMARMVMDGAHKCGGSVISERIIATSRHCLKDCPCFPKQDWHLCPNICYIKLRETSDSQADTETIHTIEAVHLPENSGDPDNFEDYFIEDVTDFALVQLTRSVNDCEETSSSRVCWPISPVHLVGPETIIRKGDAARTIGWGATFWEESSEFLRQLNLKINSNSNFEYIMETDITPDGGDPCSGDSGGPLLIRNNNTYQWMLVATLLGGGHNCETFEPSNPEQDKTGDWNKVTPHLKWIERVVSSPTDAIVNVEGSISNTRLNQLPWFPSDGKLSLPINTVASTNLEGVTQNDITNRFLALGLNKPNIGHGQCRAPENGQGSCRHIHHCVKPVYFNFFTFLTHMCIIEGRYIGVCCPEDITTTTTTTTPRPTAAPTAAPTSPSSTRECGVNAKRFQTRIVGGRPADPDEWPWLAALVHKSGRGSGQYCGATLISDTHVLTAAHCLAPFKKEDILVKLGEYDFEKEGETADQTFTVASMKNHENYNDVTYEHDIAIIKLDRPATLSNSVWPICLPPASERFTNRRAFVIGWGTIYFGGPVSSTLQEVNVRVWENSQCAKNYATLDRDVLGTMLCAGETNKDSCQGDSGGPLNCMSPTTKKWELCGVVSWGARCAEPDFPGVYTRVTEYLSWISNNSV